MEINQQKPGSAGITLYWRASTDRTGRPMDVRNNCHQKHLGATIPSFTLRQLRKQLGIKAALFVLEAKQQHESIQAMPQPRVWFMLQEHVDDSRVIMALNQARCGNLKLGNRMSNKEDKQLKF